MTGPVSCQGCGETWPRHPALEVACPDCHAPIGVHCRKPSGHSFWRHELPHVAREQLALDTGAMTKCACGRKAPEPDQPPLFEAPA